MPSGHVIPTANFYASLYDFITREGRDYSFTMEAIRTNLAQPIRLLENGRLAPEVTVAINSVANYPSHVYYCDLIGGSWSHFHHSLRKLKHAYY